MNTRHTFQWLSLGAAVIILALTLFFVYLRFMVQQNRPAPVKVVNQQHPDVGVMTVEGATYTATISGYGTATPHYELTLTSQVAGRVTTLANSFETGHRVNKGDLLALLEDSDYQAALSAARQELSEARLSLLEEERESEQARNEWLTSGLSGSPDSDLVLHQPQLEAARAAVENAQATVASARKDLEQTRITAPFDALVVERSVSPGSYLQAGGEVALLYSTDRIEIPVSLSAEQWAKLPDLAATDLSDWPVELTNIENGDSWTGQILRSTKHLDETTRKRTLIISMDHPFDQNPALLPASFLRVSIHGRQQDRLWKLPSSALSQKGDIWYVTNDNGLASFSATPSFSDDTSIYIKAPDNLSEQPQQIVLHPLSSYLAGMLVNPVVEFGYE